MHAGGRDYLMTDTVGFIRKLPHQLVDAFGATLEETRLADLILHVVDASVDEDELIAMIRAVEDVLQEIGADEVPQLLVLSKADRIDDERRDGARAPPPRRRARLGGDAARASRRSAQRIEDEFARTLREVELLIPYDEGGRLAELHEIAGDLEREETPEGVRVRGAAAGHAWPRATQPFALSARTAMSLAGAAARPARACCRPAPTQATPGLDLYALDGRRAGARRAGQRPDRNRGRDPRGPGRARAAALGARRTPRDRAGQRARA